MDGVPIDGKVKFSFSKTSETDKAKKRKNIFSDEVNREDDSIDYITTIEKDTIQSLNPGKNEQDVVIPLIQSKKPKLDKIRVKVEKPVDEVEVADKLKKEAMQKIIEESKQEVITENSSNLVIEMNGSSVPERIDEADETGETEAVDADYGAVAVEHFGLAMLRGMGSKEEIETRLTSQPFIPSRRSKGLGLGAELPHGNKAQSNGSKQSQGADDENLVLKHGTRCCILQGRNAGRYGTIDSVDGNQDRIIVTLAAGDRAVITIPGVSVRLVPETEFKKFSKYLNREKAERVKAEEEARMEEERRKDAERRLKFEREQELERKEKEASGRRHRHEEESREEMKPSKSSWVRPNLRVRIVDKKYRSGRYYKEKVKVMKVAADTCVCRNEDGKTLEDVRPAMLETVIPKEDNARVLVVRGSYRGEVLAPPKAHAINDDEQPPYTGNSHKLELRDTPEGRIGRRDTERCKAVVRLSSGEKVRLDYDDLCELVTR